MNIFEVLFFVFAGIAVFAYVMLHLQNRQNRS